MAPAVYDCSTGDLQAGAHGVFPTLGSIARRTNVRPPETVTPDWVSGVAMLLRRADFERLGGFDPEFEMYLEDVDLCRRFRLAGREIRRELRAGVVHVGNQSWSAFTPALELAHRSRAVYFRKAGFPAPYRLVVEAIRLGHLALQRTPLRRSFRGREVPTA